MSSRPVSLFGQGRRRRTGKKAKAGQSCFPLFRLSDSENCLKTELTNNVVPKNRNGQRPANSFGVDSLFLLKIELFLFLLPIFLFPPDAKRRSHTRTHTRFRTLSFFPQKIGGDFSFPPLDLTTKERGHACQKIASRLLGFYQICLILYTRAFFDSKVAAKAVTPSS